MPVGGGPPASRPRRELLFVARWCSGRRRPRRPARSPHASLRLGVVDLEARPGPATAHGRRSQALRSLRRPPHQWGLVADVRLGASSRSPARPRRRPRAPWPGPVDRAARLSEIAVTFAGAGRASIETAIAFAGEKRAFLVCFSGAEVMSVSMSPRCRALCAKKFALLGLMVGVSATKFAQRAQNGPNSAFLCLLGEFFRGNAAGGAVLGEFFRANRCCGQVLWAMRRTSGGCDGGFAPCEAL